MINCVMLVRDRPKLTRQALHTFTKNTDVEWTLTLIDDASQPETRDLLRSFARNTQNVALLRNEVSKGITGQARNLGVYWSEKYFGRGEWLYLSDNDVAFLPGWAARITDTWTYWEGSPMRPEVLGGSRHPYHGVNRDISFGRDYEVQLVDAVAGYSQLMPWFVWDKYGPLDAYAPGVCNSEDFKFCQQIVKDGGNVGYLKTPAVIHTGITRTDGSPAVGAEAMERVAGVYYE